MGLSTDKDVAPAAQTVCNSFAVSESAGLITDSRLEAAYTKISRRVVPLLMLVMFMNHIDRTNLAFAALSMNHDLGFDAVTYGLGSSLFFVTFCVFQVPANLVMVRVGVSRWLGFIVFSWGIIASCFSAIRGRGGFFTLRLLLGLLEAGCLPACWYHLSQFFPKDRLTKPFTALALGLLFAQVLSGPLAAGFLAMDGLGGLYGWQWLFLLEGFPSVVLGVVLWTCLPDRPSHAKWLSHSEKTLLSEAMANSAADSPPAEHVPRNPFKLLRIVFSNRLLPFFCLCGIMLAMAAHTFIFWLPIIISALLKGQALTATAGVAKASGAASGAKRGMQLAPVLLSSIPYAGGAAFSWLVALSSQRTGELFWHVAGCLCTAGVFFFLFPVLAGVSVAGAFTCLVLVGTFGAAANGPKSAIAARICAGPAQVIGMPFYSSVSVIGGIIGPYVTGAIVSKYGGFMIVSNIMGSVLIAAGLILVVLKPLQAAHERRREASGLDGWQDCQEGGLPVARHHSGPAAAVATGVVTAPSAAAAAVTPVRARAHAASGH